MRDVFLYRADENGIIHTGTFKDVFRQLQANPKVELCFNDLKGGTQIRVSGTLEKITDNAFKDEVASHPTRAFLKPWRDSVPAEEFHRLPAEEGIAVVWTFETNGAPEQVVEL